MKKFFADFKAFAMKGNILDMAVGVVIGGAFSKIVSSLVADIITPIISLATGNVTLTALKWVFKPEVLDEAGTVLQAEVALTYGVFLQAIIDFLIIALSIFTILRLMMSAQAKLENMKKKKEEEEIAAAEEAAAAEEEVKETELDLLREIRDLMKKED
ncbi:MAG: large conductance mechanosensitive channel protein MscL [Oscillospiraceae bacterium]|nr:large conductance mechanosensitive channel protein MscL [Oscillospiraceae bacterium]